jgi:PPOX class probable F420-dependent enzyme
MVQITDAAVQRILNGRHIASLATENEDGSIHLTAVWYVMEDNLLYVATSSGSRKAHNVSARPKASLMVDIRRPGAERGVCAAGVAELVTGPASRELNARIHRRYMSEAALADPAVGPVMAGLDDVTIRLKPVRCHAWDMATLDAAVLGGKMRTPGYLLGLD